MIWKDRITDTQEEKVFLALENNNYKFRTIEGIARETGLDKLEIRKILDKYSDLVRISAIPDSEGKALFTLADRPIEMNERLTTIRSFVTKSFRG